MKKADKGKKDGARDAVAPGGEARKSRGLVIVESPAKSRTITRFLGGGYQVVATMGHIRDLPAKTFGVDVAHGFAPTYQPMPGKEKTVSQLRRAAAGHETIYLATDEDREGEAIAWHTCHLLKKDPAEVMRVVFHEITPEAIEKAFRSPRRISENMVNAQQARRILDRIVGYTLSPLLGKTVRRGLSAGRVQSAALRLLVDREREIQAFKPQKYYLVKALLARAAAPDETFAAVLTGRKGRKFTRPGLTDRGDAEAALACLKSNPLRVASVSREEKTESPAPPFTTSTLQQEAGRRHGFSASRTMSLAQQLYEGVELGARGAAGLITYHRTDSLSVAAAARAEAARFITGTFGAAYTPEKPPVYRTRSRNAQEAHEAIRPTRVALTPGDAAAYLNDSQLKLYTLVWTRFVASQMAPARLDVTRARIECGDYFFDVEGRVLVFDGYRKVAGAARKEDLLPSLVEGEPVAARQLDLEEKETEPPPRYTESTIIKAMEKAGIGRPSTYAPTIDTLLNREYATREKRVLTPTQLGCVVNDLLVGNFPEVLDLKFTAQMEENLDGIARGEEQWQAVLDRFYQPFHRAVTVAEKALAGTPVTGTEKCPDCGGKLLFKKGKFGPFWGCENYPGCPYTRNLEAGPGRKAPDPGSPRPAQVQVAEKCPRCGGGLFIRRGKFGQFLGCANYPRCKYTRKIDPKNAPAPEAGPDQGAGEPPGAGAA